MYASGRWRIQIVCGSVVGFVIVLNLSDVIVGEYMHLGFGEPGSSAKALRNFELF